MLLVNVFFNEGVEFKLYLIILVYFIILIFMVLFVILEGGSLSDVGSGSEM